MATRRVALPVVVALVVAGTATVGGTLLFGNHSRWVGGPADPTRVTDRNPGPDDRPPVNSIYRIYLDPAGADSNSGRSPSDAIRSLDRAQGLLKSDRPTTDVEVRIAHGTYTAPPTTWTFFVPNHSVTFLPADYEYGADINSFGGRPIFRGNGESGFWLSARLPRGHPGLDGRLRFYYLQVQEYDRGGLMLSGGTIVRDGIRQPDGAGLNNNTIFGMYFTRLGSQWNPAGEGYGGVDLVNSRRNTVKNNHFVALQNTGPDRSLMHGVYLAHHSSENVVDGNNFEEVSGDPVRVRNDSNDNEIMRNEFRRTGLAGQFSEWFCDTACAGLLGQPRECPSHGNVFHDNNNVSGYFGDDVSNWALIPPGTDYSGGPGCDNDGERRVRTFGNT